MWIVSFVFHPGIQRLCEQDPRQILWDRLHKTESNRRQQAQGRHSRGGRENRAVQAGVSVYLRLGDPWQTSVGGDLHQRQYTQCKCIDCKLCAWFDLPHMKWLFSPPHAVEEKQMGIQPFSLIKYTQSVGHARTAAYVIAQTYSQLEAARRPCVRFAGASPCADVLWQYGARACFFQTRRTRAHLCVRTRKHR